MTDTIQYSRTGHLGRMVLNNPLRHNALGPHELDAIHANLLRVAADGEVRVLIVTGAGEKTFCAGASLQDVSEGRMDNDAFQQMTAKLAELAIPTICSLNGSVFGGGVELAASCDFRIGVEGSRMRVPAAEIGLCYPLPGIRRFVACLGVNTTKRVLIAAEEFEASKMLEIGFLDYLVKGQDLDAVTQRFAHQIAELAPLAVRAMKRILSQAATGTVEPGLALELSRRCSESSDLQEGFAAKREKRRPKFEGR